MTEQQVEEVAEACNRYPSINLEYELKSGETSSTGEVVVVSAKLSREGELLPENAIAPYFPKVYFQN